MSNIENGKNYPNHETLSKIADALNVKPYELYMFDYYISNEEMIRDITDQMKKDYVFAQKMYQFFLCIK